MRKVNLYFMIAVSFLFILVTGCKKDSSKSSDSSAKYVLVIDNPAQTITPDQHITYKAHLVDASGNITTPTSVTWSSSKTDYATVSSAGAVSVVAVGTLSITAKTTVDGHDYSASIPLGIQTQCVFTVAPGAIIYEKGGSLQLESVYLGPSGYTHPTCSYSSDNTSIATVSSSGLVSFIAAGTCNVIVTATSVSGSPKYVVPVMVIGAPEIVLPVVRIALTPGSFDLFRNETQQMTAKAYNSSDAEVSSTFTWASADQTIASVSSSGLVTPVKPGTTFITATTQGITGQAEVVVNPDTFVYVAPVMAFIPKSGSKQFTATAYHITRSTYNILSGITFDWMIPATGISMFDFATVDNTTNKGKVSISSSATIYMTTVVVAYDHANQRSGGAAMITVCDCGDGVASIDHITISNSSPIAVSMTGMPVQLDATAYDASNMPVASPDFHYFSDDMTIANISAGIISGTSPGTTIVHVCSGSVEASITVNVSL